MDDFIMDNTRNNGFAGGLSDYDPDNLFKYCWRRNSCRSCLESHLPCGWCPASQACVPATSGILSPLTNSHICPMWSERFELRTKLLGSNVSTLTALTAVVSVLSTLLVVGLVFAVVKWRRKITSIWAKVSHAWKSGDGGGLDGTSSLPNERTGLLHSQRGAVGRRWSYWVYNTVPEDGEGRPGMERSDTTGEETEAVGGRDFEERRRRMLQRGEV